MPPAGNRLAFRMRSVRRRLPCVACSCFRRSRCGQRKTSRQVTRERLYW